MARNQEVVVCSPDGWTQLTNDDVSEITFQLLSGAAEVRATVGATPPAATDKGYFYRNDGLEYHEGELKVSIDSFAAEDGANRLYARPVNGRPAKIIVDHA